MTTTGDGQGLRGALEALAQEWERASRPRDDDDAWSHGWNVGVKNRIVDLRAVLAAHPAPEPDRERMEALIERSSLGTPEAKAIRDSVPQEAVDRIMARVRELEESEPAADPGLDVVEQVAQTISGNVYGPSAALEKCRRIARALADAGLLVDPAATEHRLVCDQCHATKATLRAAQADRNQWKRAAEITGEEIGRWRQSLITVEGEREAAEARARRAEDALRRMTATARCVLGDNRIESDADIGDYIDPNLGELWLDVKHADRALADQTSDATPSDTTTQED